MTILYRKVRTKSQIYPRNKVAGKLKRGKNERRRMIGGWRQSLLGCQTRKSGWTEKKVVSFFSFVFSFLSGNAFTRNASCRIDDKSRALFTIDITLQRKDKTIESIGFRPNISRFFWLKNPLIGDFCVVQKRRSAERLSIVCEMFNQGMIHADNISCKAARIFSSSS